MNTSSVLATIFKSAAIFNVTHYKNIQKMRENRVYEIKNTETHRTELSRQKHLRRRTPGSRLEQKQANYTSTSDSTSTPYSKTKHVHFMILRAQVINYCYKKNNVMFVIYRLHFRSKFIYNFFKQKKKI